MRAVIPQAVQNGFILVEVLVYLVLFSIIIGGGLVAAYQIMQGAKIAQNHTLLVQEAGFLMGKISWVLENVPMADIILDVQGNMLLDLPDKAPVAINASTIGVSGLEVEEQTFGGGLKATAITFTLETSLDGYRASRTFSSVKYLGN